MSDVHVLLKPFSRDEVEEVIGRLLQRGARIPELDLPSTGEGFARPLA